MIKRFCNLVTWTAQKYARNEMDPLLKGLSITSRDQIAQGSRRWWRKLCSEPLIRFFKLENEMVFTGRAQVSASKWWWWWQSWGKNKVNGCILGTGMDGVVPKMVWQLFEGNSLWPQWGSQNYNNLRTNI